MTGPGGKPTGTLARRGRELPKRLIRRWLWSVGHVLADVEALGGGLDPGTGTPVGLPGFRPITRLGKSHAGRASGRGPGGCECRRRCHRPAGRGRRCRAGQR